MIFCDLLLNADFNTISWTQLTNRIVNHFLTRCDNGSGHLVVTSKKWRSLDFKWRHLRSVYQMVMSLRSDVTWIDVTSHYSLLLTKWPSLEVTSRWPRSLGMTSLEVTSHLKILEKKFFSEFCYFRQFYII